MIKNLPANEGDIRNMGLMPRSERSPWQPTPVFLPEKSQGRSSLVCYSPWDRKESNMTEQLNTNVSYLQFLHLFNAFPSTPYSVLSKRRTF